MRNAPLLHLLLVCGLIVASSLPAPGQEIVVSPKRTAPTVVGKTNYPVAKEEQPFLDRKPDTGKTISVVAEEPADKLTGKKDAFVAWFGIVRETPAAKGEPSTYLVEHKYFDGVVDFHQQLVSIHGAGDFRLAAKRDERLKPLSLVRVYGKVVSEKEGVPTVKAEFIRIWTLGDFGFAEYGTDASNKKWAALRKRKGDDVYMLEPTPTYYEELLGKP